MGGFAPGLMMSGENQVNRRRLSIDTAPTYPVQSNAVQRRKSI